MNISRPLTYAYLTALSESAETPQYEEAIRSQIPAAITDKLAELGFADGTMTSNSFYEMKLTVEPLTMVATITCDEYINGDPVFIKVVQDPKWIASSPEDASAIAAAWTKVKTVWDAVVELNGSFR